MTRRLAFFLLGAILLTLPASARYISLQTELRPVLKKQQLFISVSSINKGDESAYNVWGELRVLGKRLPLWKAAVVEPSAKYEATITLPLDQTVGPLLLTMHYQDANHYPFSALSATLLENENNPPPLWGAARPVALVAAGEITLALKNQFDQPLDVNLELFLPAELTADFKPTKLKLAPNANRAIKIKLTNFSALPGSSYQLFAIARTAEQTIIIPGTVRIEAGNAIFGFDRFWLIIILVGLGAFFLAAQIYKR
ncbi:MAG: hypothetical protein WCW67_05720 [Candidatus Margulisiibacteriota bacterium]|jgi:hypothetical protein